MGTNRISNLIIRNSILITKPCLLSSFVWFNQNNLLSILESYKDIEKLSNCNLIFVIDLCYYFDITLPFQQNLFNILSYLRVYTIYF